MPFVRSNPVVAAIQRRRACPCPPLQVANGTRSMPGPQVASDAPAAATEAAWLPTIPGQVVPMPGEVVADDAEPCFNE